MFRIPTTQLQRATRVTPSAILSLSLVFSGMIALVETVDGNSIFMAQAQARPRGQVGGRTSGGASRGACPQSSIPLTAIVPYQEDKTFTPSATYVGGVTKSKHPTFWFYVPYSLTPELKATFILKDENEKEIYQIQITNFPESGQSNRILAIEIPQSITPLEPGQVYQWYFQVDCQAEPPIYVNGGIERILPNDTAVAQATPMSYDQITALGNRWRSNPQDMTAAREWANLLHSFGINDDSLSSTTRAEPKSKI